MPDQSISPPAPLQQVTLTADDLKDPSLLNNLLQNHTQLINYILGHGGGPPYLKAGANFGGQPVKNVGTPAAPEPGDVVTHSFAESNYGAPAIAPQIQSMGKSVMQSYRRLNDRGQREQYSSFLKNTQSTPPTANTATVSGFTVGGSVDVTVSAGLHQYVDGTSEPFMARTDALPLPASFSISSLSRSGNIVTATLGSTFTGINGDQVGIGSPDTTFQGIFIIISGAGTSTVTYQQIGPNGSAGGGTMTLLSVFYYTRSTGQTQLGLVQVPADTWSNRTSGSIDGTTIVAVVVVNNLGIDLVDSSAGATPPISGSSVPVIRRL